MSSAFNIPAGFALVPLELADDNLFNAWRAAGGVLSHDKLRYIYAEMIAAALAPPVDAVPGEPVADYRCRNDVSICKRAACETACQYAHLATPAVSRAEGLEPSTEAAVASVRIKTWPTGKEYGLEGLQAIMNLPDGGHLLYARTAPVAPAAPAEPSTRYFPLMHFPEVYPVAPTEPSETRGLSIDEHRARMSSERKAAMEAVRSAVRQSMGKQAKELERLARAWVYAAIRSVEQKAPNYVSDHEEECELAFRAAIVAIEPPDRAGVASPVASEDTQASRDVLAERARQVSAEGWTPEHDDEHDEGELCYAAAGYASSASDALQAIRHEFDAPGEPTLNDDGYLGHGRPWPEGWTFKPAPPRRMLVKAGALILAELERIDRASAGEAQS